MVKNHLFLMIYLEKQLHRYIEVFNRLSRQQGDLEARREKFCEELNRRIEELII